MPNITKTYIQDIWGIMVFKKMMVWRGWEKLTGAKLTLLHANCPRGGRACAYLRVRLHIIRNENRKCR
eukprot:COSAG05_NODE_38_length_27626_cov_78.614306_17_plen_68_part_00